MHAGQVVLLPVAPAIAIGSMARRESGPAAQSSEGVAAATLGRKPPHGASFLEETWWRSGSDGALARRPATQVASNQSRFPEVF